MIVLLDINNRLINVYHKDGLESFDFSDVNALKKYSSENEIIYITNAVKTNIEDIIDTVKVICDNIGDIEIKKNERLFIRATKGNIIIEDMNFIVRGPIDFKPLSNFDKDFLDNSRIKSLIKSKKLEIVTESEMKKILSKVTKESIKKQSKVDKSLDSILVPIGTKAEDAVDDEIAGPSDAIEIEINPNALGGIGTSNENSLAPETEIDLSGL